MSEVLLGYEVGSGQPVNVPVHHTVVAGQTQSSGKTTALEAMINRSGLRAVTFITKRGESGFTDAVRIDPYFREQADWQFVASILEASRGEKLKFERAWIIRASKGARTLADVQRNVRKSMETAKGMSADVYLTLDAYLEAVVPQIEKVRWAPRVSLQAGVNAMDLTDLNVEMQHLVIKSTIDWVLEHEKNTVVVVPEAWKFIPQGRGTPVKLSAEAFIRQSAALHNFLWLDSQDIGGIDKVILRSVPLWILGVQREANEIKRTLDNIPAGIAKPSKADIAYLDLGQFYACWKNHAIKTYVRPSWMNTGDAQAVSIGGPPIPRAYLKKETEVTKQEADALRAENLRLADEVRDLTRKLADREPQPITPMPDAPTGGVDYESIRARLLKDPAVLRVLAIKPEITVEVRREVITASDDSLMGRLAILISEGWWNEARTANAAFAELKARGVGVAVPSVYREADKLALKGFLRKVDGGYRAAPDMKVNIVHA